MWANFWLNNKRIKALAWYYTFSELNGFWQRNDVFVFLFISQCRAENWTNFFFCFSSLDLIRKVESCRISKFKAIKLFSCFRVKLKAFYLNKQTFRVLKVSNFFLLMWELSVKRSKAFFFNFPPPITCLWKISEYLLNGKSFPSFLHQN